MAQTTSSKPPAKKERPILFKNALVLSARRPYSFCRSDVLVDGQHIAKISANIEESAAQIVDCRRKALIPGLVNAHAHLAMSLLRGIGDDLPVPAWLSTAIWPHEKRMGPADIRAGVMLACSEMIHAGVTTFNDKHFHGMTVAEATRKAGLRALIGQSMRSSSTFKDGADGLTEAWEFAIHLNHWDGQLIRASLTPPDIQRINPQVLNNVGIAAQLAELPLHIHVAETAGEAEYTQKNFGLGPIEFLAKSSCLFDQSILAHATYVRHGEIEHIAQTGASVVYNPRANMRHANGGITPVCEYLEQGINVALGTDSAPSNGILDILGTGATGAALQKHLRVNASALNADDILYMATDGGAKALGFHSGRIEVGYLADIVLLNMDSANLVPYSNGSGWLVYSAGPHNVSDVMVNGRFVQKEGKILTFNEADVLIEAQERADNLRQRAEKGL